jgi:hypothetical protein
LSFLATGVHSWPKLDHDVAEIGRNPAVWERLRRLGKYFLIAVATGNVGQHEQPDVALGGESGRFRRGKMSAVSRERRVASQESSLDHHYVGAVNVLGQALGGFGIADNDELLLPLRRPRTSPGEIVLPSGSITGLPSANCLRTGPSGTPSDARRSGRR